MLDREQQTCGVLRLEMQHYRLLAAMLVLPEGVRVQLQSVSMCPGYQVSVVVVVPRCRTRCKCNRTALVSKAGVKASEATI